MADIKREGESLLNVQLNATTPNIAKIEKIEAVFGLLPAWKAARLDPIAMH